MEHKKVDILDEALRVLYLEDGSDRSADEAISRIKNTMPTIEMPSAQKAKLFEKLNAVEQVETLGMVIAGRLNQLQLNPEQLSQKTLLPLPVIQELLHDRIYTNNVPIMFFQTLLKQLGVSFQQAEQSIRKTFLLLQQNTALSQTAPAMSPAFRKGQHVLAITDMETHSKSDGRELYENEEALSKYLNRLNQLLTD